MKNNRLIFIFFIIYTDMIYFIISICLIFLMSALVNRFFFSIARYIHNNQEYINKRTKWILNKTEGESIITFLVWSSAPNDTWGPRLINLWRWFAFWGLASIIQIIFVLVIGAQCFFIWWLSKEIALSIEYALVGNSGWDSILLYDYMNILLYVILVIVLLFVSFKIYKSLKESLMDSMRAEKDLLPKK